MNETAALKRKREEGRARLDESRLERMAPRAPRAAIDAFVSTMDTYAARVEALVHRHVISQLPVLGSGDPLDLGALDRGLSELQTALNQLADKSAGPADTAAKRVLAHSRGEVGRLLNLQVPPTPELERFVRHDFQRQVHNRLLAAGRAQVDQIRKAIVGYEEGTSLRKGILDKLWVSRNRGRMVAADQAYRLEAWTQQLWAQRVGSDEYVWLTCADDRVRPGHAVLHRTKQKWSEPPNTGRQEGRNHPGQAVHCRCRAVPVEALLVEGP